VARQLGGIPSGGWSQVLPGRHTFWGGASFPVGVVLAPLWGAVGIYLWVVYLGGLRQEQCWLPDHHPLPTERLIIADIRSSAACRACVSQGVGSSGWLPMARCGRAGSRAAARRVPRNRPAVSRTSSAAIGDRAYSSGANRACLRKRGDQGRHPGQGRSENPPPQPRQPRRSGARLRPWTVQRTAIPPDAASASSSGSAPSPPAMTSANSCIREPSIWRRSASSYETLFHDPWDTL
jgi:hypothetical protein